LQNVGTGPDGGREPEPDGLPADAILALALSCDRCDIESLRQEKPNGFKPILLNAAGAGGVKAGLMAGLNFFPSNPGLVLTLKPHVVEDSEVCSGGSSQK
jgi:hypothetical protein